MTHGDLIDIVPRLGTITEARRLCSEIVARGAAEQLRRTRESPWSQRPDEGAVREGDLPAILHNLHVRSWAPKR